MKYLSTQQVAVRLKISRIRVAKMVKEGKLRGEKCGRGYIIPEHEVMRWKIKPTHRLERLRRNAYQESA